MSKVFPGTAPEKTTLPYIVFLPVSNNPSNDGSGVSKLDHIRMQISVFGRSYREVELMAKNVRMLLDEFTAEGTEVNIQRITLANEIYISEGNGVHHKSIDYMFYVVPHVPLLRNVKNGRIYNFYAVSDTRGLAPNGWHVATDAEWTILEQYLIGNGFNYDDTTTGNKIAKALATASGWNVSAVVGSPGNADYPLKRNITGFSALPSGARQANGSFAYSGGNTRWWTASEQNASNAWSRNLDYNYVDTYRVGAQKNVGQSVRCVRNGLDGYIQGQTIMDCDGNVYGTVQIGTQVWMKQNYACTKYSNGNSINNVTDNAEWGALTTGAYCSYDNSEANVYEQT
jgi:uncharacterized protein (TIGR02145 family)